MLQLDDFSCATESSQSALVKGFGMNLWLTDDGIMFDLQRPVASQPSDTADSAAGTKPLPDPARFDQGMKPEPPKVQRLVFQ